MTPHAPRRFVLKGGPQSGKTSLFARIKQEFGDQVLFFPEVASILLAQLWPAANLDLVYHQDWRRTLQRGVFHTQRGLEEFAYAQACAESIPLIGHDRGVFDNAGYLRISGRELAEYFGEDFDSLMANYDIVIHLDTIATLHPEQFGSDTNAARYETSEEAIALDERIWQAYIEHPKHIRIPATEDFDAKCALVMELLRSL